MLEAPAAVHQLDSQPVEQFGMRRGLALHAEVLAGRDDPGPEIGLPDPVDDRPRGGGRLAVDQPSGECQPRGGRARGHRIQERGHTRLDWFDWLEEIAPLEDLRWTLLLPLPEYEL